MTTTDKRAAAADTLWSLANGERSDGKAPPELLAYGDETPSSGLRLQLDVLDRWRQAGRKEGGWKVGWTSRGARDRGGKDFRPFGYILEDRIHASGVRLDPGVIPRGKIEAEICLTIGERLAGEEVTPDEARAAVRAVSPSFEILSHRLPDGSPLPVRIGNGLNNWGLVVGSEQDTGLDLASLGVELRLDGEVVSEGGAGQDVLDDPYVSLSRVCRVLNEFGLGLEPGQRVITGSVLPGVSIDSATSFEASFGELGSVSVEFG